LKASLQAGLFYSLGGIDCFVPEAYHAAKEEPMSTQERTQVEMLMVQIEEMWGHLNTLFDSLNASGGWGQKHGPHWTFADVPYHLAYCHEDLVVHRLELGPDLPAADQELLATQADIYACNDRKFAERAPEHTVTQSLAQFKASCEHIRRLATAMTDADLARPFFMPLLQGWVTAHEGLEFVRNHDWSEFTQLRLHMGRGEPIPSPVITAGYVGFILQLFPMMLNQEAAAGREFTVVLAFTDPGVGAWTIRVAEGQATLNSGAAENPDLVITQSADTFEKTIRGMYNPLEAIQSGEIQVSNFEGLAMFGELFPM
jgi:putative sterol carrier protein